MGAVVLASQHCHSITGNCTARSVPAGFGPLRYMHPDFKSNCDILYGDRFILEGENLILIGLFIRNT